MGLLRTAARTAVITGTATRVHNRVSAKQQGQWAQQTAAPPAAPPPVAAAPAAASPQNDRSQMLAQLSQLGELRDAGVLTEAEFEVQKARILHM